MTAASVDMDSDRLGRRGLLARFGAALVGASAASLLKMKRAEAHCLPVGCSGGHGCICHGGCPPGPTGGCCWTYVDEVNCRVYRCCDLYCPDTTLGVCRYLVCYCC